MLEVRQTRLGGIAGLTLCFLPATLLDIARFQGPVAPRFAVLQAYYFLYGIVDGGQRHGALVWHQGAHWAWDYGSMLAAIPAMLAIMLIAPLVGYRRRDALMFLVPGLNLYIAWIVGSRAATLPAGAPPTSTPRGATAAPRETSSTASC